MHVLILGAGFAGNALARALLQRGARVSVQFDERRPAASDVPAAMLNPITSRQRKLAQDAEICMAAAHEWLDAVDQHRPFGLQRGVIRAAFDAQQASQFAQHVQLQHWPPGWMERVAPDAFARQNPALHPALLAYRMINGRAFHGGRFLQAARSLNESLGADYRAQNGPEALDDVLRKHAGPVVYCTGFFPELIPLLPFPLHPVKGQVDSYHWDDSLNTPVTSEGYLIQESGVLHVGSTYHHQFETVQPEDAASNLLNHKAAAMLRTPLSKDNLIGRWTGIRMGTPDRKPVAGPLSIHPNFWLMTGFGSKGLYYAPYMAERVADAVLNGSSLPSYLSINRFIKRQKGNGPKREP